MDFSLSTIGCTLPVSLTCLAGKRKLALHSPSKPQAPLSHTTSRPTHKTNNHQRSDDSVLTASNASSWCSDLSDKKSSRNKAVYNHRDSFLVYLEHAASALNLKGKGELDDDDTATTASFLSTSSSSNSLRELERRVTFCETVVTEVRTRPYTSRRDKYFLHYNEHDYVDFKMEYITGKGRNRKVSFQCEDATVHELPAPEASKQDLFYSEHELQG